MAAGCIKPNAYIITFAFMSISIRPAVEADQSTIEALIQQAKLNPRNLHWENFLVAEENGNIVGIRQVKIHRGGTREVASGFVLPEYRRRGISAQLMIMLLARETGPLYTMVNKKRSPYYEQFGFQQVDVSQLPSDFRKEYRIGRIVTSLLSLLSKERVRIVPLKREPS